MTFWLLSLVFLLGFITYLVVQRNVASITRTPVWILWLVMMTPALIWSTWTLVYGENNPPPPILVIGPFVTCTLLYWLLIRLGRIPNSSSSNASETTSQPGLGETKHSLVADKTVVETQTVVKPINKEEEASLQSCFPWSVYYVQNIEYRPQAVICRGQLRTTPDAAYQTIRDNIEAQFGDRFLVMLQEGANGKPFFALVPNPQSQQADQSKQEPLIRPGLALGLLVATLFTTTLAGIEIAGVSVTSLSQLFAEPQLFAAGLPYALALLTILGIHESGHYLTARFYKVRATLPYFIPIPFFLGTFGAFIQIRSPIPNRKALFDLGISGPMTGLIITLPILIWGLMHSTTVPATEQLGLNFNALNPSTSFLLALLSKLALGAALTSETAIKLHPVAIAGCLGLIVTALNLMPVGQLDGGHVVHAMFGQRTGALIGQVTRLLVLGLSLVQPDFFLWAVLLFFMPVVDGPALNDVSELDNRRDLLGLFTLGLLLIIILPAPRIVTQILGF
ncbi:MAG: site-2 protease family protein [Trichocoleus desertorum ATA4-8-CV12]|jgi:membrane-associated protease RseP (regulator of RpoE activity)|nr:site-2 protease family protein [Trichocoleus desertorum ATA4-8-CV12]